MNIQTTNMQNVYMSKDKALRDFGLAELDARETEIYNSMSVANQIMYKFHLNQMITSYNRAQETALQAEKSCKQCENTPPEGEENYS